MKDLFVAGLFALLCSCGSNDDGGATSPPGGDAASDATDGAASDAATDLGVPSNPLADVVDVATATESTCALLADGSVRCFGRDTFGSLGDGAADAVKCAPPTTADVCAPRAARAVVDLPKAAQIVGGDERFCARATDGTVWCWGYDFGAEISRDAGGACPSSAGKCVTTAFQIPGLANATAIATGRNHTCALLAGGTVTCFGSDRYGQLGDGTISDRDRPAEVPALDGVVEIAAGGQNTCARKADGSVWCWGDNSHGQLGSATPSQSSTPVQVAGVPANVAQLAVGGANVCARTTDGFVFCWGDARIGVTEGAGDPTTAASPAPTKVKELANVTAVAIGINHACAVEKDGSVWCWGCNHSGQLGRTASKNCLEGPAQVAGMNGAKQLAAGSGFSCARNETALWCWGENGYGQLGDGNYDTRATPGAVVKP